MFYNYHLFSADFRATHISDMSDRSPLDLQNLILTVECKVCGELLDKPKKLINCAHVFCCECIKKVIHFSGHGKAKCPLCRKEIQQSVEDVELLEPGIIEVDVIAFIKSVNHCDLCERTDIREIESIYKCLQCGYLICSSCQPIHQKLQPLHIEVCIFGTSVARSTFVQETCDIHKYSLELYCLMCKQILCLHCDKYLHAGCLKRYESMENYMAKLVVKTSDMFQRFVVSSDLRKTLFLKIQSRFPEWRTNWFEIKEKIPVELRVVHLQEFAAFCRFYLGLQKKEVENDVAFYNEYIDALNDLKENQSLPAESVKRFQDFQNSLRTFLEAGNNLDNKLLNFIKHLSDTAVGKSAIELENLCVQYFSHRKALSLDVMPFEFTTEKCHGKKDILKQNSKCKIYRQEEGLQYLYVAAVKLDDSSLPATSQDALEVAKTFCTSIKCMVTDKRDGILMDSRADILDNSLHSNTFMKRTEAQRHVIRSLTVETSTLTSGFTEYAKENICLKNCNFDTDTSCVHISIQNTTGEFAYSTSFNNLLAALPMCIDDDTIYRTGNVSKCQQSFCLIGSNKLTSGLETVFLKNDTQNGLLYGISIKSKTTRFKHGILPAYVRAANFRFLEDNDEAFSFVRAEHRNANMLLRYQSKQKSDDVWAHVNISLISVTRLHDVPITGFTVDLLCDTKRGMLFVRHEENPEEMTVGLLKMRRIIKRTDLLYSVKQEDITIPLGKLKPVTVAETEDEVVVVCCVSDDNKTFVMILPLKQEVEILQVQYPDQAAPYVETSIIDLEMDSNGNIMYIIEDRTGTKWRVITKYIMPAKSSSLESILPLSGQH